MVLAYAPPAGAYSVARNLVFVASESGATRISAVRQPISDASIYPPFLSIRSILTV
jgi:hypothetical protein